MSELPEALKRRCRELDVPVTQQVLCVDIARQRLRWFEGRKGGHQPRAELVCSTSKFGIGQREGSNCTPLGLHRIAEKIGDGEPVGTIFRGRVPVGHVRDDPKARITTRILWLDGLEPGFNQGGEVDTHARYVYIHGTGDETMLGRPDSHGCVHLAAADLVPLFDAVPSGTLVWIAESLA